MLRRKCNEEFDLPVKLEEPLTSDSCCKLISELVKYLLYQKQQIPVTYEYLVRLGASSPEANARSLATARATLKSLENISEHLNTELCRSGAAVKEIVISMGATLLTPKLCVRVSLPPGILSGRSHYSQQHSSRKPLLSLMRSMTEWKEFQEAMTLPLLPTNTFILIQKNDCNRVSEFFLPKPRYSTPNGTTGSRFHIRLGCQDQDTLACDCSSAIKVYHDQDSSCSNLGVSQSLQSLETPEEKLECFKDSSYQWYQSRDIVKGFKFTR